MNTALLVSNITLWVIIVGLAIAVFALARQIGVLHERISPAGALMISGGPKVGEAAPVLELEDIGGDKFVLGAARDEARSTLLFFLSPNCPVCKTLLPVLKSSKKSERDWLDVYLASDGDAADQRAFIEEHSLGDFRFILSSMLGMTYQVGKLPFAVLLDGDGIIRAKGLVNSREHLESLFEAQARGVASIQQYVEELS